MTFGIFPSVMRMKYSNHEHRHKFCKHFETAGTQIISAKLGAGGVDLSVIAGGVYVIEKRLLSSSQC